LITIISPGINLLCKLKLAISGAGEHVFAHELFKGTVSAEDKEKWLKSVTDWEQGKSKTNPFVSKHVSE
jgi:hypothetical protein